jgi:hypothetical protein
MIDYVKHNYGKRSLRKIAEELGVYKKDVLRKVDELGMERISKSAKGLHRFKGINPLCDSCRYATPLMCRWMAQSDIDPVPEYNMSMLTETVRCNEGGSVIAKVTQCSRYEAGPLPPFGQVWPAERREVSNG